MSTSTPPNPPAAPPTDPPVAPPNGTAASDDELAGLDARALRFIERANSQAAASRHELRNVQAELERMQRERETDQERRDREVGERERAAGRAERDDEVAGLRRQVATGDIRARAAGRFADPEDAVRMLDLDALLAEQDERKRADAVEAALGDLLKSKPYLARAPERGSLITQGGRSAAPDGRARERSWLRG